MAEPVVRYKNRSGIDTPVNGALTCIPIQFTSVAAVVSGTSTAVSQKWTLPTGMKFKLSSIQVSGATITSDPALAIGTSAAGTQVVASVNVTSTLGSLTLKTTVLSGSTYFTLTTDTGDSYRSVMVNLVGHWAVPPDSLAIRNTGHF